MNPQQQIQLPQESPQAQQETQLHRSLPDQVPRKKVKRLVLFITASIVLLSVASVAISLLFFTKERSTDEVIENSTSSARESLQATSVDEMYDALYSAGISEFSADKKQQTLDALSELAVGFDIDTEFYEDQVNTLLVLGTAKLYVDSPTEKQAFRNQLYVLAAPHIKTLPDGIDDKYFQDTHLPDADMISLLKEYSDAALTKRLVQALDQSGILAEVKKSLKLSDQQGLQNYTLLATDFVNGSQRQQEFAKKHHLFGALPKMWVESIDGEIFIISEKTYAEDFIKNPNGDSRHSFVHEFVHAQHSFVRGDTGRAIEERRAELFSGDRSSYYDAKQFFIYSEVFSGKSPLNILEEHPADPLTFYVELHKMYGLATAHKFAFATPQAFLSEPSGAVKVAMKHTGNMDGVIQDLIKQGMRDKTAMDARIEKRLQRIQQVFKTKEKVKNDIQYNLAEAYKMPSAAKQLLERL